MEFPFRSDPTRESSGRPCGVTGRNRVHRFRSPGSAVNLKIGSPFASPAGSPRRPRRGRRHGRGRRATGRAHWWVLVRVAAHGRLSYSPAVEVRIE